MYHDRATSFIGTLVVVLVGVCTIAVATGELPLIPAAVFLLCFTIPLFNGVNKGGSE